MKVSQQPSSIIYHPKNKLKCMHALCRLQQQAHASDEAGSEATHALRIRHFHSRLPGARIAKLLSRRGMAQLVHREVPLGKRQLPDCGESSHTFGRYGLIQPLCMRATQGTRKELSHDPTTHHSLVNI